MAPDVADDTPPPSWGRGRGGGERIPDTQPAPSPPEGKNTPRKTTLVIGIGNPGRGDDALGPLAIEALEALNLPGVELLTDYQLQVEFLLDLDDREAVIFVDASVAGDGPYQFAPVVPGTDASFTSHSLSPSALLAAYQSHYGRPPPPCQVLAIRAHEFELGAPLSPAAAANLEAALAFLAGHLANHLASQITNSPGVSSPAAAGR